MQIKRRFTTRSENVFDAIEWTKRTSRISNPDGSVVFEMNDAEVPKAWSQLATDIMVSKYFRKAGVPQFDDKGEALLNEDGAPVTGPERSARQVIQRLVGCWRHWGEEHGYFDSKADAQAYEDELAYMLLHQMAAPNSPQWFNTGLNWAYGITGPAQGHFIADPATGEVRLAADAYTHPQPHACFIQGVSDDLVNEGGIMDLWVREARLFKYGSGTGTNFSRLRAENEPLSGGGKSSGLMSWLKIGDRAAGAIKSGGTTRRAAKMVCLDLDHPDIEKFIDWKVREEVKVAALVEGLKMLKEKDESIRDAAERVGLELDYDFNGEAYYTVSGQNSNNSVRIPDAFFETLDDGLDWDLTNRTDGEVARSIPAGELWDRICYSAWRCADPGVQYDSTINAWHTCPESGRINASNPCSEYMFLDNTACNLASINLLKFYNPETRAFDVERYEHAIDLWTITLEISVLMASFPSEAIAKLSWEYRTLGLGYANIGAMLMQAGLPYDSAEARAIAGSLTAILTGRSYRMSALMAREHGPFAGYKKNADAMLRVIRNHRAAARGEARDSDAYEDLKIRPVPIDHAVMNEPAGIGNAPDLLSRATAAWDDALALGEKHGYRNAQTTVIAPTGTIGLLMDCDTTGVEPDFALVKFKKLAGGGYFKIANASLRPALEAMGYSEDQIRDILRYVLGTLHLNVPMPAGDGGQGEAGVSFLDWLHDNGLSSEETSAIEDQLPSVFELGFAFSAWSLADETLEKLGVDPQAARSDMNFSLLRTMGLTGPQIEKLNEVICGTQTIEGAPHLREEHLPVFDCANRCGKTGRRFIAPEGHIRMMGAAQSFISGAISKTINLPAEAAVEDIARCYRLSWELGLKANALYRDGCKLSQPLSSKSDTKGEADADDGAETGRLADDVSTAELRVLAAEEDEEAVEMAQAEIASDASRMAAAVAKMEAEQAESLKERVIVRPMRRRLPDTRHSLTHKFNIAGHEGYLTVGLYENGLPGELFITMAKEGSTIGGLMDSLGTAVSVALQYGVPIESLVNKFTHQRFEPAGMTTNQEIPFAKSLVDYIFRWLGIQFVPGYRDLNSPRRESTSTEPDNEVAPSSEGRRAPRQGARTSEVVVVSESFRSRSGEGGVEQVSETAVLSAAMRDCQGDAPACDACGAITVRNGACYKCLNCGHSMGCS